MIQKVVHIYNRNDPTSHLRDLEYWLSRPVEERISAVEILRRQMHGELPRMQKVARIVSRADGRVIRCMPAKP